MSLARVYSAGLLFLLMTGAALSHGAEPAPRAKPRSFSDEDLQKYVHLRTKSTPLPDSADAPSSAATGPLKVITPEQLAADAARKPYVRKPPVYTDAPDARQGRKDESKINTGNPAD